MSYGPPTMMRGISSVYTRKCPTCNGSGINPVLPSRVCPKCRGERVVPIRWHGS